MGDCSVANITLEDGLGGDAAGRFYCSSNITEKVYTTSTNVLNISFNTSGLNLYYKFGRGFSLIFSGIVIIENIQDVMHASSLDII